MLSIVVPCYNEQDSLQCFFDETLAVLKLMPCDWEIIFVDDGSSDATMGAIKDLAARDVRVRYISLTRNFGKESALYAGMLNASGDYVALMDADLQDPPSLLPQMYEAVASGSCKCAIARRTTRTGEPRMRSWLARLFYRLAKHVDGMASVQGERDYRVMRREVAQAVLAIGERNRYSKGLFNWAGFDCRWFDYENEERASGKSKWGILGLFKYAIEGITSFSHAPLTVASWFGVIMTVVSFVMLVLIVVRKLLFGDPVAGWASTICVIIFIGGLQLLFLGIMGQYLSKAYIETKQRPHYVADESNIDDAKLVG